MRLWKFLGVNGSKNPRFVFRKREYLVLAGLFWLTVLLDRGLASVFEEQIKEASPGAAVPVTSGNLGSRRFCHPR